MTYWLLRMMRKVAQVLPLRVCYAAAVLFSRIAWLVLPGQRRNATDNMAQVLGRDRTDPEARRKARDSFKFYAYYMVDFLRLPNTDPAEIDAKVRLDFLPDLDAALSAGRGVVFISAHAGNWDTVSSALVRRGYPVTVVVDTFHPPKLNDLVQGHRCSHGTKVIQLEDSARRVLGTLRKNGILGLLIDIPSPENGVQVHFFGKPAYVPAGPALLALKTGARVLAGIVIRNPDHSFTGLVTSQFDLESTGDFSMDVKLLTQRIVDTIEGFIKEYPEQWFIFRPMWPRDASLNA